MFFVRCLVRQQGHQRFSIHRRPHCKFDLYANLHRRRRQRNAVRYSLGNAPCARSRADGDSEHNPKWIDRDLGVVFDERNVLCGFRRLDGRASHQRNAGNRRDERHDQIHADLHWNGWVRVSVRDGHSQRSAAERQLERESHQPHERRRVDFDVVLDERNCLHRLGRVVRKLGY